jgi:hypothetical protein
LTETAQHTDEPQLDTLETGRRARSLLSLIKESPVLLEQVKNLPHELLDATERELERDVKPKKEHRLLKIAFWDEYKRAQRDEKYPHMVMENVYHGICGRLYFYQHILRKPPLLAWLITPPPDELIVQKELLRVGFKRLNEVLHLPFEEVTYKLKPGRKGQPPQMLEQKKTNVPLIKEVRAIVEMLQNRVHGAVIQRQQIEAAHLHKTVPAVLPTELTPEKLDQLSAQLDRLEKNADVIDGELSPTQDEDGSDDGEAESAAT